VTLAEAGHVVTCVEKSRDRVAELINGTVPFYEPGLQVAYTQSAAAGKLKVTDEMAMCAESDVIFVCVGTPTVNGTMDTGPLEAAIGELAAAVSARSGYRVVAVKSTVLPWTCSSRALPILTGVWGSPGPGWDLVMTPEFLREGVALEDSRHPDRIVVGAAAEKAWAPMETLYERFGAVDRVSWETAELCKYVSNTFFAQLISLANDWGRIAERIPGADVMAAISLLGRDRRVQDAGLMSYLVPGCGFGGSCFPKDVAALAAWSREQGAPASTLEAVLAVNRSQPAHVVDELARWAAGLDQSRVAVLGLSFKPDSDDVRATPAWPVIQALVLHGATVRVFDPRANDAFRRAHPDAPVDYADSLEDAVASVDGVVIAAPWAEFHRLVDYARPERTWIADMRRAHFAKDWDARGYRVWRPGVGASDDAIAE
jgi:UDPglucose 6-dehydrogenase/GDP-mannose 6-dehydrogenase